MNVFCCKCIKNSQYNTVFNFAFCLHEIFFGLNVVHYTCFRY